MKLAAFVLITAAQLLLCGCGGPGGTGGGVGGGTGGGNGGGAGGGTGAGGGKKRGVVSVRDGENASYHPRTISGVFYEDGVPAPSSTCTWTTLNGCSVQDCNFDGGAGNPDAGPLANAGSFSVRVGSSSAEPVAFNGGFYILSTVSPVAWWDGGEIITVTATGSDAGVPAMSVTLTAPTRLSITVPSSPDGGAIQVIRNSPLAVAWPSGAGEVDIILGGGSYTGHYVGVGCPAQATAGTFTIPASVTQLIPSGPGSLLLQNSARATTTAGAWSVETTVATSTSALVTNTQ
jgi:hypothetical protein